ncbi:MAG TPA: carbohydrate kinase family protein [Ktedonobacteraceae bacterium]
MTRTHFDVLVIGSPCVDLVFSGLPHWPVPGQELYVSDFAISAGAIFNTAAALSRLGLCVGLLGELGNDLFSRYLREEIERAGICADLLFLRDYPLRAISVCLPYKGERGFISFADAVVPALHGARGTYAGLAPDMLAALAHVACEAAFLYISASMGPVLDILSRDAPTIFLDAGWSLDMLSDRELRALARHGHYMLPNQAEASQMTGKQDPVEAVRALARFGPTAVIKLGAAGAIACRNNELFRCPALPVTQVVDTTGAGDAFNAGFIYGTLQGYALPDALRCATICGSLSTTAMTGTAAVPTAADLERLRLASS